MARDKFISDDLYNMRERFKRNHSEHLTDPSHDNPDTVSAENVPDMVKSFSSRRDTRSSVTESSSGPAALEKAPVSRLPQIVAAGDDSDISRERRELEGKMLRDLSFVESEETFIREHAATLEKFRTTVERLLNELTDPERPDTGKINKLRIEYFQARGRFESSLAHNSSNRNTNAASAKQASTTSQWPLAIAIISGALLMSVTMIWLFKG